MAVVTARARAEGDRRVSLRPTPEAMTILTAYLPMTAGIAAFTALDRHARMQRTAGDERSIGQIAADTLVERVTGQDSATGASIEIGLVMTDAALVGDNAEPARIEHGGPIPAPIARQLVRETSGQVWVRRLRTDPITGSVCEVDSRRRLFTGQLRRLIIHRDQVCRTPWCGAPIRHLDHAQPVHRNGPTSIDNGQGLCERCNYVKENPGWRTQPIGGHGATVLTTPTGHTYRSIPPPAIPGSRTMRGAPAQLLGAGWEVGHQRGVDAESAQLAGTPR